MSVKPGIHRHFKGGHYDVKGIGIHTETGEELVVYSNVDEPDKIWLRPVAMWDEEVYAGESKGMVPRFTHLGISSGKVL